ncbi:MAG: hypothetical protein AB8G23_01115 [Myxococcota bacterium]
MDLPKLPPTSQTSHRGARLSRFPAPFAFIAILGAVILIAACSTAPNNTPEAPETPKAPQISFANGESNWIITEGLSRSGRAFTFKEVQIDGNGWLVLHPFKDGRPNGAIHVGASYLRGGLNENVTVNVTQETEPQSGEMFLVMLHSDVNEDQVFDFVFVDERNVLDKAVFEGMTMIAHTVSAP